MNVIACPTPKQCNVVGGHLPGSTDAQACASRQQTLRGGLAMPTVVSAAHSAGPSFLPTEQVSHPRVDAERTEDGRRTSLSIAQEQSFYPVLEQSPQSLRLTSSASGGTMLTGEVNGIGYGVGLPAAMPKGTVVSGFGEDFDGDYANGQVLVFAHADLPEPPPEMNAEPIYAQGTQSAFLVEADPDAVGALTQWVDQQLRQDRPGTPESVDTSGSSEDDQPPSIGTCPECGTVVARTGSASTAVCPGCKRTLKLKRVKGTYNPDAKCTEDSCRYARAHMCSCSCGGAAHGRGYADEDEVPEEIRERDRARFEGREERRREKEAATAAERERQEAEYALQVVRVRNEELAATLDAQPQLQYLLEEGQEFYSSFLASMAEQLDKRGYLSPRQTEIALQIIPQEIKRSQRDARQEAAEAAARAAGVTAPVGKRPLAGYVEDVWSQAAFKGPGRDWKMRIRTPEGYTVQMGVPSKVEDHYLQRHREEVLSVDPDNRDGWKELLMDLPVSAPEITLKSSPDDLMAYGIYAKKLKIGG